jgi:hypothetical protein
MKKVLYPLTGAQMMHHVPIRQYGTQKVSNISMSAALQTELDFDLLGRCIREEFVRSECLRVRLTAPDRRGRVCQYIAESDDREVPLVDMTDLSLKKAEETMQNWAYETFDEPDSPMSEFRMIRLAEGYNGFFLHIDHRLADSFALSIISNDIMELYCHYKYNAPYPEKLFPYREALERDIERATGDGQVEKDRTFWKQTLDELGEPLYSDIRGKEVLEKCRRKHKDKTLRAADRVTSDLSVSVSDYKLEHDACVKLEDFCRQYRVTMNSLLLFAMRTYLSKQNDGQEDISVRSFIARRTGKKEIYSGGSRTIAFPCRTIIHGDTTFLDAVRYIQDTQRQVYRHSNYDVTDLDENLKKYYHIPEMTGYESCWLTYQPFAFGVNNELIKSIPLLVKWYPNGAANKKVYLTVSNTTTLEMLFSYHYQSAIYTDRDMELFYYYMMRILFKGIENPDMSVEEIMKAV